MTIFDTPGQLSPGALPLEGQALEAAPPSTSGAAETVEASLQQVWTDFLGHLPQLVAGAVILVAVGFLSLGVRALSDRVLRRTALRASLRELASRLIYIAVWALGLLLVAMVVFPGLTPTKALSGLGIASVAIGFAFKDIFENFFAGIIILWRFPFDNGDFIECDEIMGRVEEITIRNTLIRKPTGELIVVPNSKLFTEPVEVLTNGDKRRVSIVCGIAYGEPIKPAVRIVRSALKRCRTVADSKPVDVLASSFGSSSVDLEITWWTDPEPIDIRRSKHEVVSAVKGALDAAGIEIPFPYRTLTFKEPLGLTRSNDASVDPAAKPETASSLPG